MNKTLIKIIREGVRLHIQLASTRWDDYNYNVLDIAPQVHKGAKEFFHKAKITTLDINKESNADVIADICEPIDLQKFDCIICTEVLEHVSNPFNAANNLMNLLKKGGELYCTTPFGFRIHNPLPDNWRFTEHGIKQLFNNYSVTITKTEGKKLLPLQYQYIVSK